MSSLYLQWHLGLGDAIICNGLVRVLAQTYDEILLPAKLDKMASVIWMFSDLPNVFVVPVKDDSESTALAKQQNSKGLGCWSKGGLKSKNHWDEQFYSDASIPFEYRWSEFKLPYFDYPITIPMSPYAFLHQDTSRGYVINAKISLPIREPVHYPHMFWNIQLLKSASEVHVIDSSFLNLAESIPVNASKLVLHRYARNETGPPTLRKQWEMIS